jgi:hypothetical protein
MTPSDLDAAVAIIDDARHAITGPRKVATTEAVLFGSESARLVREWEARRLAVIRQQPPAHVMHHRAPEADR